MNGYSMDGYGYGIAYKVPGTCGLGTRYLWYAAKIKGSRLRRAFRTVDPTAVRECVQQQCTYTKNRVIECKQKYAHLDLL